MNSPNFSFNRTRRKFLSNLSGGMLGSASLTSALLNLQLTGSLAAADGEDGDDYRALVCVFLLGGNDSFNMVAPVSGQARADYEISRGSAAYPLEDFLPLVDDRPEDSRLGLHRKMSGIHSLYGEGKAALIANVGTLAEPTTLEGIRSGVRNLPLGLFSHSDQQKQWQSGLPRDRSAKTGWAGRASDLLKDMNGEGSVPMSISFAGANLLQSGEFTIPLSTRSTGAPTFRDWQSAGYEPRRAAIEGIFGATDYSSIYERHWAQLNRQAMETAEEFRLALEEAPAVPGTFDLSNSLSRQLKGVADVISARGQLSKKRQTFFVTVGGWDNHSGLSSHPDNLALLSKGISDFHLAMQEMRLDDHVTLFTASDFGRTLTPNGNGTDHGWGGNQIVVGGGVKGGKVYGSYPSLALDSFLDVGRGRLIPTMAVDEFVADLALWMGVSPTDLPLVLPNLSRFHDVLTNGAPLGLFAE
jgi:uncharacterized protein (DUF1501 family)